MCRVSSCPGCAATSISLSSISSEEMAEEKKINTSIHIRLYQLVLLIKSYMMDVSSFQTKIHNKPLSLRSTDWKAFSSNNKTFDLVRVVTPGITKRNKNSTFWGSPFSVTIWLVYVIVRWREQGPSTCKIYFENIILSTRGGYCRPIFFFWQVERIFLVRRVHQTLAFLTQLITYAWIQNHIQVNLRRHKKTKMTQQFTYVRVNLIFQPSLATCLPSL